MRTPEAHHMCTHQRLPQSERMAMAAKTATGGRPVIRRLRAKASSVLPKEYRPEIDVTEELGHEEASYYQSLIGVLRWMVELGRVDICTEVSMMSSHLALPRKGHLEALFHVFAYLKTHHNSEMVFDPSEPEVDMAMFPREDWSLSIYGDAIEELPPRSHGRKVDQ